MSKDKDKKDKKEGRKFKMGKQKPLKDALDDNDREQIEPCEEPLPNDQDEKWAYPGHDKRVTVSSRTALDDKQNGEE
jgi:hypothetical protein